MSGTLKLENVNISIGDRHIIRDLSLAVPAGELHIVMGPNGSGKSTLAQAILGHPECAVTSGTISFNDEDLLALPTHERARKGIALAFQHPPVVPGISIASLLWTAQRTRVEKKDTKTFLADLRVAHKRLGLPIGFADRSVNDGFSGGEQKKSELLQLLMLEPKLAIIDEPDSGLDIDALKIVGGVVGAFRERGTTVIVITHNPRLLGNLRPDAVHVLIDGSIVRSGGFEIMHDVERDGYQTQREAA